MDLFSFNLAYTAREEMVAQKKFGDLEHALELALEMTHMLWHMRANSSDLGGGLRRIALGLMTQLFFTADPKDKLHFLMRSWQPATFSKPFLQNLVEMGYMTFKVLELRFRSDDLDVDKHVEAELKVAKLFDMYGYVKKLATSDVVETHRTLLEFFAINEPRHNPTVSFFRRLCATEIREYDFALEHEDGTTEARRRAGRRRQRSSSSRRRVAHVGTYEPLLYNVPILAPMTRC